MQPKKYKRTSKNYDKPRQSERYNYYNSSSEAYDYAPDVEYQPTRRSRKKVKKVVNTEYISVEQEDKILSWGFIVCASLIASLLISILMVEAKIIEKRFYIGDLTAEVKSISDDNVNLETELAKNLDFDYIEKIATEELGMQKPASHQIIYIEVPKESYAETNRYQATNKSFFEKLFNK